MGTTGSALLPKVPLVLVKHLQVGHTPKRSYSERLLSTTYLQKLQFLSTLRLKIPCNNSQTACQLSFTYIFGPILTLRKGPSVFKSQQTAKIAQNTRSVTPPPSQS